MTTISTININDTTRRCAVETTSDCSHLLHNEAQREYYLSEFGDVEVVYDEYHKIYRVPAHKVQRAEYVASKARHCMQYGAE